MRLGFGDDFRAAKAGWLYQAVAAQSIWWAVLFVIIVAPLHLILQNVFGVAAYTLFFGTFKNLIDSLSAPTQAFQLDAAKSVILGIFPACVCTIALTWWFANVGNLGKRRGLALHVPQLGIFGWSVLIAGFVLFVLLLFYGTFELLGIDPKEYQASSGGLSDQTNKSGVVEKTMADLVNEPWLFAIAVPGIVIATPIVEEMIFRGAIFDALSRSWFGNTGAVLITSASWALLHKLAAPWLFVGMLFMMGILLGVLLLRFGSLWVTIACHAVWNSLTIFSIFNLPGVQ
jgi:uncharacterized protein